eukprot:Lankesteria_metandrocarpae@DN5443_c1_g2_i1.p1
MTKLRVVDRIGSWLRFVVTHSSIPKCMLRFTLILTAAVLLVDRAFVLWTSNIAVVQTSTYSIVGSTTDADASIPTLSGASNRYAVGEQPCAFRTNIPMYYINLDRSSARRAYIEERLRCTGKLTRVAATDAERGQLDKYVNTGGLSKDNNWKEYTDSVSATVAEVALTSSHLRAIQTAHANGDEAAIIFEDDVGMHLVPLWLDTPDELLAAANEKFGNVWEVMFLQFYTANRQSFDKYVHSTRAKPSEIISSERLGLTYGFVAYMMSRRGMQRAIDTWSDSKDGRLNCLQYKKIRCVADIAFHRGVDKVHHGRVYPTAPVFLSRLFEDSTGVRSSKMRKMSDQYKVHLGFNLNSILRSTERYELQAMANALKCQPEELVGHNVTSSTCPMFNWIAVVT